MFKGLRIILLISLLCLSLMGCHSELAVEIVSPHDGATVYRTPIGVKGMVSEPSAHVTINDTPVVIAENGLFIGGVDLTEGENTITVVAISGEGETATKAITVTHAPSG
mgnify:CR=1 FL=1